MASPAPSLPDALFRIALDASPVGYVVADSAGRIVWVNGELERIFGYDREELVGQQVEILLPKAAQAGHVALRAGYMAAPRARAVGSAGSLFGRRKDGAEIPVEIGLRPIRGASGDLVLSSVIDISARRALEDRLRQAEKMEAVGAMAGGIAHDFNNLLLAVVGYTELVVDTLPAQSQSRADLEQVLKAAERGRQLIRRMLLFSRRRETRREAVSLHEVVHDALVLVRASLPASIDVHERLDPSTPPVCCDVTQIHQIVMNLATNSAQAIGAGGGVLTITVAPFDADDAFVDAHPGSQPGPQARLTVSDSGGGMSADVAARAFEPFYTTKEEGEGTGLGLAVTQGIVIEHGGVIDLRSRAGHGATFDIFLPATEIEERVDASAAVVASEGSSHILYVEDNQVLLELGRRQLAGNGYRVTAHGSSLEALADFGRRPESFDLLITDNNMPQMPGQVLVAEVLKRRPGMKVLMVSGLADGLDSDALHALGIGWVLQKPHTREELDAVVREALEAEGGGGKR